ncbi:MAG: glycerophosphodiester phosphodiesterase, partial [Actinobacteria bacterium]|nr:glycerophosphodiester phosphodiesterase [Actinomycetota bacterium]
EHTAASYRLAFESGVDAIEPDVVVTSDGVLVVRHENEISGTTDVAERAEFAGRRTRKVVDGETLDGWFAEDFTWAELATLRARERVPQLRPASAAFDGAQPILRLRDVLALVDVESTRLDRAFEVVIELKHVDFLSRQGHDLVGLLLAELTASGWADRAQRLVVECFELGALRRLRAEGWPGRLVFLMEHAGGPADRRPSAGPDYAWYRGDAGLGELAGLGMHGISLDKLDILADPDPDPRTGIVARAHAQGLVVFTWTLRPENHFLDPRFRGAGGDAEWGDWQGEWRLIRDSGVDGVFVDHPELWRQQL